MAGFVTEVAWDQVPGGRPYQEDHCRAAAWPDGSRLLVLADGMGGEVGGARASRLAVDFFHDHFVESQESDLRRRLHDALNAANSAIKAEVAADRNLSGMGTTLVGLACDQGALHWISVGDSPLWLCRQGAIQRLNANHSVAGELDARVANNEISAAQAAAAPNRHQLLEAVMGHPFKLIDCPAQPLALQPGDILLLASDGVETCAVDELQAIVAASDWQPQPLVAEILRRVLAHGKPHQDNATLMALTVAGHAGGGPAAEPVTRIRSGR